MNLSKLVSGIAITALCVGCAQSEVRHQPKQTKSENAEVVKRFMERPGKILPDHNNTVGFKLLARIISKRPNENVCISPFGLANLFGIIANGANGHSLDELVALMGSKKLEEAKRNEGFRLWIDSLQSYDSRVEVQVANSIWLSDGLSFSSTFKDQAQEYFGAQLKPLTGNNDSDQQQINKWVSEQTRSKITELPIDFYESTVMVALNAIYFKGEWLIPFDAGKTRPRPFTTFDGSQKDIPTMASNGGFSAGEYDGVLVGRIHFVSGYSLIVAMPLGDKTIQSVLKGLGGEKWDKWIWPLHPNAAGDLQIPKFKFQDETNFLPLLENNELKQSCTGAGANFTRLADQDTFIATIDQKTTFEINEQGGEASAASSLSMATESIRPRIYDLVINRPFIFALFHDSTGTNVMVGVYGKP